MAGPVLRHTDNQRIVWWLVSSVAINIKPVLFDKDGNAVDVQHADVQQDTFCVGQRAFIQLITLESTADDPLIQSGVLYHYDLLSDLQSAHDINSNNADKANANTEEMLLQSVLKDMPHLVYEGHTLPNFRFNQH
jgi:hypothetical protein